MEVYSINEAYYDHWSRGQQPLVSHLKREGGFGSRYVGSLVAYVHRSLLQGGLHVPRRPKESRRNLRLLYEAAPMALIVEPAGGRATASHAFWT